MHQRRTCDQSSSFSAPRSWPTTDSSYLHRWRKLCCGQCTTRILVWSRGRERLLFFCVDGVTSAEKTTLKQVNGDTDSEVANMGEGTWRVCWVGLSLNQMIALRNATQQLSPAPEERWESAFFSATSSIGEQTQGSYLPIVPTVTRLVTGSTWTVTVYDGYSKYSQTCSSSSTSCSVNQVATLSPGEHTITTTITGYAGSGSTISRSQPASVWCD
jgi:hypothetical protein